MVVSRQLLTLFAPFFVIVTSGCSSSAASAGESGDASSDASVVGSDGSWDAPHEGEAGVVCCPPDPQRSGCMHLGGAANGGRCIETCDFFCSQNWRIAKDELGCDAWTYDYVPPGPGQGPQCQPIDGGTDADAEDGSDAG